MNKKLIFKSPKFVPFGANLAQFEAKSGFPGCTTLEYWGELVFQGQRPERLKLSTKALAL